MRGIKNIPKNSLNYLKLPNDPNGQSMLVSSTVPPSYWSNLGLQRGLALVRILEIPILSFIHFLPDATVRSRSGERASTRLALMLVLTFDRMSEACGYMVWTDSTRMAPRVPRDCAKRLAGARFPVPLIFGFLFSILAFHVLLSLPYAFLHPYKFEIHLQIHQCTKWEEI
ncbi:hypothetical protein PIB30_077616 [Stylosanthes scabra]|uniref:Uncharacterized protein n=1 Tax=Stylosanthes scabra TaxID=79078 RepID=A0ABU6TRA3_9FABA|nr:hypothetical protein [Stylosanthes scabra]